MNFPPSAFIIQEKIFSPPGSTIYIQEIGPYKGNRNKVTMNGELSYETPCGRTVNRRI